jgi:ATP-dependent exoDNAse (exonuclease V) alpha subunit
VDPDAGEIVVSFDGRSVTYGFGELDMVVPAYAATIHKSQGSEYPAVIGGNSAGVSTWLTKKARRQYWRRARSMPS